MRLSPYAQATVGASVRVKQSIAVASALVAASSSGSSGGRTGPVVSPTRRQAVLTAAE